MCSAQSSSSSNDRTAKARIRDGAIECVANHGLAETTARKVATAAGVSPGLVMHHFGSMEGLLVACDEHVAATIRDYKSAAVDQGPGLDLLGALRQSPFGPMVAYLARRLHDDTPAVANLIDDLIADAEGYLALGVETGMLKPSDDPRARAVVLAMWSLGSLVLHRHLERLLGVDLTDPNVSVDSTITTYLKPIYEIFGEGLFTEEFASQARAAVAAAGQDADITKGQS